MPCLQSRASVAGLMGNSVGATGLPAWGPGWQWGPPLAPAPLRRRGGGGPWSSAQWVLRVPLHVTEAPPACLVEGGEASAAGLANNNSGRRASCCPGSRVDVPPSLQQGEKSPGVNWAPELAGRQGAWGDCGACCARQAGGQRDGRGAQTSLADGRVPAEGGGCRCWA